MPGFHFRSEVPKIHKLFSEIFNENIADEILDFDLKLEEMIFWCDVPNVTFLLIRFSIQSIFHQQPAQTMTIFSGNTTGESRFVTFIHMKEAHGEVIRIGVTSGKYEISCDKLTGTHKVGNVIEEVDTLCFEDESMVCTSGNEQQMNFLYK